MPREIYKLECNECICMKPLLKLNLCPEHGDDFVAIFRSWSLWSEHCMETSDTFLYAADCGRKKHHIFLAGFSDCTCSQSFHESVYGTRVIRSGLWPVRTPDMTTVIFTYFTLKGSLKDSVCKTKQHSVEEFAAAQCLLPTTRPTDELILCFIWESEFGNKRCYVDSELWNSTPIPPDSSPTSQQLPPAVEDRSWRAYCKAC